MLKKNQNYEPKLVIPVCFWCGDHKKIPVTITVPKGTELPSDRLIIDYEPCDKCKGYISKGVQLIGTSTTPMQSGMIPININEAGENLYPDQSFLVVPDEFVIKLLEDEPQELIDDVLEKKALLVDSRYLKELIASTHTTEEMIDDPEEIENMVKIRCADCDALFEKDDKWYCNEAKDFCANVMNCPEGLDMHYAKSDEMGPFFKKEMTYDRALELLNEVIDNISVANDTPTTIDKLLTIGFTENELVGTFGFLKEDVKDVFDSYDEEAIYTLTKE